MAVANHAACEIEFTEPTSPFSTSSRPDYSPPKEQYPGGSPLHQDPTVNTPTVIPQETLEPAAAPAANTAALFSEGKGTSLFNSDSNTSGVETQSTVPHPQTNTGRSGNPDAVVGTTPE